MKKLTLLLFLLSFSFYGFSQDSVATDLNKKWDDLLKSGETFQNYKVIKKTNLADFWKNAQDSVSVLKSNLAFEKTKVSQHQTEIIGLKEKIETLTAELEEVSLAKDEMGFLGMRINKYTYATILWVVIGLIFVGCAIIFFMYVVSNKVTVQKISEYEELFNRFEDYKKNTIEKERKLKRDLQTQLNLTEELKNRRVKVN